MKYGGNEGDFLALHPTVRQKDIEVIRRPKSAYAVKSRKTDNIVQIKLKSENKRAPDNYNFAV